MMRIIEAAKWEGIGAAAADAEDAEKVEAAVAAIIAAVRAEGDAAVKRFAAAFDRSSPARLEVPLDAARAALAELRAAEPDLFAALEFSAANIKRFALAQREQLTDFEVESGAGSSPGNA
jgi:histidinol dehydrogenase